MMLQSASPRSNEQPIHLAHKLPDKPTRRKETKATFFDMSPRLIATCLTVTFQS